MSKRLSYFAGIVFAFFQLAQAHAGSDPSATNCANCGHTLPDNSAVGNLNKTLNGLQDKTNCNGQLTDEASISIAQGASQIAQQFLDGNLTEDQAKQQLKAVVSKNTSSGDQDQQLAAAALAAQTVRLQESNYALKIGLKQAFGKQPYQYTAKETQTLEKFGIQPKDFNSFIQSQAGPYLPYMTQLASVGAKFSAKNGWDFSKLQCNLDEIKSNTRLQDSIKWATGIANDPQADTKIQSLLDPTRNEALQLGNYVFLPPQPQKDPSGKVEDGEIRAMTVDDYNKTVADTLNQWKSSVTEELSANQASTTLGNLWKQTHQGPSSWKNWLSWTHLVKGTDTTGDTPESSEAIKAGNAMTADEITLVNQLGVPKDLKMQILNTDMKVFEAGSNDTDKISDELGTIVKGLHWAPVSAVGAYFFPVFAAITGGLALAKSAVTAAVQTWKFGWGWGQYACHLETDTSEQAGDDLLSMRWTIAGAAGKVFGALGEVGTGAYFAYGMGKASIQEVKASYEAHKQAKKYQAQGNTQMANAASEQSWVQGAQGGIDAVMTGFTIYGTAKDAKNNTTLGKATTNYLNARIRASTHQLSPGDEITDPAGNRYQITKVTKVNPDATSSKAVPETVYQVKQVGTGKIATVFQSDLVGKGKVRAVPLPQVQTTQLGAVANAAAAKPGQTQLASNSVPGNGQAEGTAQASNGGTQTGGTPSGGTQSGGGTAAPAPVVNPALTSSVTQSLFDNSGNVKTGWGGALRKATTNETKSITSSGSQPVLKVDGNDVYAVSSAGKQAFYVKDGSQGYFKVKDPKVASQLQQLVAEQNAGASGSGADTQRQLASVEAENARTPAKQALAVRLWNNFQNFTQKTSTSVNSAVDKALSKATGGRYDKVKLAAANRLIIEQAVSSLSPAEAKDISDKLAKDPQAEQKVQDIFNKCGIGGAAPAAKNDEDFLKSIGVLYTDRSTFDGDASQQ